MILVAHNIAPSLIPGSGDGLFLGEAVRAGAVIAAPLEIDRVLSWDDLAKLPPDSIQTRTSVRWFEERYAVADEWTPECFINHSFEPTALVHLGFVFALGPLAVDAEVTIDYRLFLGEGHRLPFDDSISGEPIVGFSWAESMRRSSASLAQLFVQLI